MDNFTASPGIGGDTFAADEITGVKYPRSKIGYGSDGAYVDVDDANPLPAKITDGTNNAVLKALSVAPVSTDIGIITQAVIHGRTTAGGGAFVDVKVNPSGSLAADVSGSTGVGVTGTFWQATQPVSAASLPLPTGAATETTLAALQSLLTTLNGTIGTSNVPYVPGSDGQIILARRRDTDSSPAADGDLTVLNLDEEGRLKVATKPASYAPITGNITGNAQTIPANVERFSNLMIHCAGTFSTVNVTFEGSLNSTNGTDGNWFLVQAIRSSANTIETATGNLSAAPTYAWELSVNALKYFRVRSTAFTSGTQVWTMIPGTYATEPIPGAQISGTQPVSGTVTATVTPPAPTTPYFLNSAATTNGALIITGTSGVQSLWATNEGASPAYIKLYNKATAPTVGTDVPEMIIPVPAAVAGVPGVANPNIGFIAFRFALGLGISITRNAIFSDTTAIGAGEVKVKLSRTA